MPGKGKRVTVNEKKNKKKKVFMLSDIKTLKYGQFNPNP